MRPFDRPKWWFGLAAGSLACAIAFSIDWRLMGLVFLSEAAGILIWEGSE